MLRRQLAGEVSLSRKVSGPRHGWTFRVVFPQPVRAVPYRLRWTPCLFRNISFRHDEWLPVKGLAFET